MVICKYIKANYSKEILKKYFDASTTFINEEYINREHNDVTVSLFLVKSTKNLMKLLIGAIIAVLKNLELVSFL